MIWSLKEERKEKSLCLQGEKEITHTHSFTNVSS